MAIRFGRGAASFELNGDLERAVRRTIDRLAPTVGQRLERTAGQIADAARAEWPVGRDRGRPHSRDLFDAGLRVNRNALEGYVTNRAPYASVIRFRKGLGGKSVAGELLRKPLKEAAAEVARDLADDVRELWRRNR